MNRPTETLTAAVSSLVAATIVIIAAFYPGVAVKIDAEVSAAIVLILSWVATIVTYFTVRRLRNPESPLVSAADGSVQVSEAPPSE